MAATFTLTTVTNSTVDATSYVSSAFTPATNDLLLVAVHCSQSIIETGTLTSSAGLTFYLAKAIGYLNTSLHLFVAESLASAISQTVTFDCTGDGATANIIDVIRISGMSLTGAAAVVQVAETEGSTGVNASVTFPGSISSSNPVFFGIASAQSNPGQTAPSGMTAGNTANTTTPADTYLSFYANAGLSGTTLTCGGPTFSNNWAGGAIELNADSGSVSLARSFGVIF